MAKLLVRKKGRIIMAGLGVKESVTSWLKSMPTATAHLGFTSTK